MGVIMQTFYWDCPKLEDKEYHWWLFLQSKITELKKAGFTALWLPPASKAANLGGMSMGYDPYDYYDLGNYDQKGSVPTWFGSHKELVSLIEEAHANDMQVYADLVLNHTNGADEEEVNEYDGKTRWTKYNPKSNRFKRDWTCYHPSPFERWDNEAFEGMPDLCHRNPGVYTELMKYASWLIEDIGFDGFRYDFVKGYGVWLINAILEQLYKKENNRWYSPFGVGEYWDNEDSITHWLQQTNAFTDNPVSAFDFPLRYRLKDLCDTYDFSLTTLAGNGTLVTDGLGVNAVTFVENHDVVRNNAIVNDKILAYAYILTHEGYPCVFWQDYYNWNLAQSGTPNGIDALVSVHEKQAGGATDILYCDHDLYIMQRRGTEQQLGLVFVLNNAARWNGIQVTTQWRSTTFTAVAWCGKDAVEKPDDKATNGIGQADFWAPPRGYAVYVPHV